MDLENHKCIPLAAGSEAEYRGTGFSDSDSSFYTLESILDDTYRAQSANSDLYNEHIYEEITDTKLRIRPLPPIPETFQNGSIFTGATKSEILHFLNDAKLRLGGQPHSHNEAEAEDQYSAEGVFLGHRNNKHRISAISNISDSSNSSGDSSGDGSVLWRGPLEKMVR